MQLPKNSSGSTGSHGLTTSTDVSCPKIEVKIYRNHKNPTATTAHHGRAMAEQEQDEKNARTEKPHPARRESSTSSNPEHDDHNGADAKTSPNGQQMRSLGWALPSLVLCPGCLTAPLNVKTLIGLRVLCQLLVWCPVHASFWTPVRPEVICEFLGWCPLGPSAPYQFLGWSPLGHTVAGPALLRN